MCPIENKAQEKKERVMKVAISILCLLFIVGAVAWVVFTLGTDVGWCFENYSIERIPHCMWFENSITGRFIQP